MNNEVFSSQNGHGLTAENFLSVFPVALRGDQTIAALAEMAAEAMEKRAAETSRPRLYPDVMSLPEDLLDILAYDFAIDWWDPNYSLDEKRRIFKASWYVHKHLGTKAAVEQAISAIYPETRVEEWFEYGGQPYHFRLQINISDDDIDSDRMRRVLDRLYYYKNLRSHNDGMGRIFTGCSRVSRWTMGLSLPTVQEWRSPAVGGVNGHSFTTAIHTVLMSEAAMRI